MAKSLTVYLAPTGCVLMSYQTKTNILRNSIIILAILGLGSLLVGLFGDAILVNFKDGFGVIQMGLSLMGLSFLTFASYLFVYSRRPQDVARSLQADIGVRLGATGLVFAICSGMSDLIGVGTHRTPRFDASFIGPLQIGGVLLGTVFILIGLGLYHTSRGKRASSSLEFVIPEDEQDREA